VRTYEDERKFKGQIGDTGESLFPGAGKPRCTKKRATRPPGEYATRHGTFCQE
jgi:hypothetical protein